MTPPFRRGRGRRSCRRGRGGFTRGGFTLVELLLAGALGMGLCTAMLQLLMLHGDQGERLVRLLRERGFQRRTLELLRDDLHRADGVLLARAPEAPCPLAGRQPLLQIEAGDQRVVYSLGPAPSAIWRGWVLMRCGPAFGLDGEPSPGASLNRVVLDGLAAGGVRAEIRDGASLQLQLSQAFALPGGGEQRIASTLVVAAPVLP